MHLTVSELHRSVAWYQSALGLRVHSLHAPNAELGDGTTAVIALHEDPAAAPLGRHAGLYHYALLYPSREELARAAVRLAHARTPIQGASDHGTHEAIYLPDADGLGIELAADRSFESWPSFEEEFARGGPLPLDFDSLLSTVAGEQPPPHVASGLRVGHVHLHVGSVEQGLAFYRDTIGFELQAQLPTAAFVSAGGYHHHLGFNTWRGEGIPPMPRGGLGLRHWTIELERADQVNAVRCSVEEAGAPLDAVPGGFQTADPWAIAVRVIGRRD